MLELVLELALVVSWPLLHLLELWPTGLSVDSVWK